MAREIAINMVIDTKDAQADLVLVEESLTDIEQSLKKIGAGGTGGLDKELEKLNRLTTESTMTWGEMGKAIEQYQNIALAAGKESPVGQEAIRRASELKQEMDLVTQSVDGLSKKGQNLQAALQLGGTVVAGYGVAQSAMALMGTESEKLQETFVKLQLAQTALVSIEQIRMSLQKESFLMQKLTTMWTTAQTFATGLLAKAKLGDAAATGVATTATRAFTAALIATGIGAIVVALGLLIANWDKVTEAVKSSVVWLQEVYYKFQNLGAGVKIAISIMFPFIGLFYAMAEALEYFGIIESEEDNKSRKLRARQVEEIQRATDQKLQLIQKEIDAEKKKSEEVTSLIDWEIEKKKAAGEDYAKLEKDKILLMIRTTQKQAELMEESIRIEAEGFIAKQKILAQGSDALAGMAQASLEYMEKAGGEEAFINQLIGTDEDLNALKANLEQATKDLELFNIKQEKLQKDAIKKKAEENKKANEKELADEKKHQEDLLKAQFEAEQKQLELEEKQFQMLRELRQTEEENEIDRLVTSYEDKFAIAMGNAELEKALEEQLLKDIAEIQDKYRKDEEVKDELTTIQKWEKRLDIAGQYTSALQGLTTHLFEFANNIGKKDEANTEKRAKRQFAITKALAISEASIDTGKAIVKAVASSAFPANLPAILFAATTGAAQIAAIASRQFSGGASGGGSGAVGSITSGSVGRANTGNQTDTTTNIEQLLNGNQGQGNQPVLVTDSLTKVQNKQAKIESLATL